LVKYDILEASGKKTRNKSFTKDEIQGRWTFKYTITFDSSVAAMLGVESMSESTEGTLEVYGRIYDNYIKGNLDFICDSDSEGLMNSGTYQVSRQKIIIENFRATM